MNDLVDHPRELVSGDVVIIAFGGNMRCPTAPLWVNVPRSWRGEAR